MTGFQKTTEVVVWLLTVITAAVYVFYLRKFESLEDIIISLIPAVIFVTGAILIYSRDNQRIFKASAANETAVVKHYTWAYALKHDLLIYIVPFIILVVPFIVDDIPAVSDVLQAGIVFLTLSYLKLLYWGEL